MSTYMKSEPKKRQLIDAEQEEAEVKIYKTTNYDQFTFLDVNREIDQNALRKLIKSIGDTNLLYASPIIVTGEMKVIDGQHRLFAAKALGLPIYFLKVNEASLREIILLNDNMKTWQYTDYVHAYKALGLSSYFELEAFAKEWGLSIPTAATLLGKDYGAKKSVQNRIRAGRFVVIDKSGAENIASTFSELKRVTVHMPLLNQEFIVALALAMERVDPKELIRKFEGETLNKQTSKKNYLLELERILNKGKSTQLIRLL